MSTLDFDPKRTALVLIDLQYGIVAMQLAPRSGAEVVKVSAQLAESMRAAGGTVVYVRVDLTELRHVIADVPGRDPSAPPPPPEASQLLPESGFRKGDLIVTKRQWGALYGTELDQMLRRKNIQTIVLGGIATNFGVESTARAAHDYGYHLVLVEDAMATISNEAHELAVKHVFPRIGQVRTAAQVREALAR